MGNWFRENVEKPWKKDILDPIIDPIIENPELALISAFTLNPTMFMSTAATAAPVAIPAYQAKLAKDAGDEAEGRALTAAEWEAQLTMEQVRILEEENERTVATARARSGASGLSGASSELYISALEETGRQDVEWLKKVGVTAYQSRIDEGRAAQAAAEQQMWGYVGQSIHGIQSTANMFASFA